MIVRGSELPGVLVCEPQAYSDGRGFFLETYRESTYGELGLGGRFVQDNHSRSSAGVLRGLHYQLGRPQAKLVQVVRGEVYDVAVDIRRGSPTFGRWVGVVLSDENHLQLYVPEGFAHGFCVLSETADFSYKCSDYYDPGSECGILWNDSDIGIAWPREEVIVSPKDAALPRLSEQPCERLPLYHV